MIDRSSRNHRHEAMNATVRTRLALVLEIMLVAGAVAAATFATVVSPGRPQQSPHFVPATLGDQPPGAVVLAREDGGLAVGLAVAPRDGDLLLVATVFGQSGAGLAGLRTSFAVTTAQARVIRAGGAPCTAGCYQAAIAVSGRPTAVTIGLGGANRVRFTLPRQWPPPAALSLVREAEAAYRQLRTLVTHERLASDLTHVVYTTYYAVAPNELRFAIRGGLESIIIGSQRWDREPGQAWQRSPQAPIRPIAPYWTPHVQDATTIGSATIDGRPCWVVAFADPQTPGFFMIWIDKATHRTVRLQMTAAAHFMRHSYGPFNAPLAIHPPSVR